MNVFVSIPMCSRINVYVWVVGIEKVVLGSGSGSEWEVLRCVVLLERVVTGFRMTQ